MRAYTEQELDAVAESVSGSEKERHRTADEITRTLPANNSDYLYRKIMFPNMPKWPDLKPKP